MDEQTAIEIERLKEEIYRQKENISDVKQLVNSEIDRDFAFNPWELSERELDSEMGDRLSLLNDDVDTRPDPGSITSHRGIAGKLIVRVKRLFMKIFAFYTNTILEKQRSFNEQLLAFHLASFVRFRHNERKIKDIRERLSACEEDYDRLSERLEGLPDGENE